MTAMNEADGMTLDEAAGTALSDMAPFCRPSPTPLAEALPPTPEDVVEAVQAELKAEAVAHSHRMIELALRLFAAGPKQAARACHLVERVAALQLETMRLVGAGPRRGRHRRVGVYGSLAAASYDDFEDEGDAGVDIESATLNHNKETFANQALQQLVAVAKQAMTAKVQTASVGELTQALATAKQAGLGAEVTGALEAKLGAALGGGAEVAP